MCLGGSAAAAAARLPPPPLLPCLHSLLTLPFTMPSILQLYSLFGKYGAIRQIRVGNSKETRGTAYVVYEASWLCSTAVLFWPICCCAAAAIA